MTDPANRTLTKVTDKDREAKRRPLDFGIIVRLMQYTRPYASLRNTLLFLVLFRACQLPALAALLAWVIHEAIANAQTSAIENEAVNWQPVVWGVIAYFILASVTQYCLRWRMQLAMRLSELVIRDLRDEMFMHLQKLPMSFFDQTKVGRIISRFASDAESVRLGVQDVLFVTLVSAGQMVVAAIIMAWYDFVLFSLLLALAPLLWMINRRFHAIFSRTYRAMQESFSRVTATVAESVTGVRVTQGFVRQDLNAMMFSALVEDHAGYNVTAGRTRGMFFPLLQLSGEAFVAAMLFVGAARALYGQIDPEILVTFFFLANVFFVPIRVLGMQYDQALSAMAGAERVFRLIDTEPQWQDASDAVDIERIDGRVEFRDVSFGYNPAKMVLHDLHFTAEPGQIIALVGHTGSGKSSVINLISKFYLPDSGELLIDGREIRQISSESLHAQLGIVLQQNFLFSGNVIDNIRIGRPDASDDEVIEAARRLDCLDLLEALPDGLQTRVGERGGALSLGQRQLVCFTRAMLANPAILILDEATSSVDTMTEARIQSALERLLHGRTSFVVAHRLSTIRRADLILVLDHGRIIERGSHNQLLATAGVYANLYRQFIRATEG